MHASLEFWPFLPFFVPQQPATGDQMSLSLNFHKTPQWSLTLAIKGFIFPTQFHMLSLS